MGRLLVLVFLLPWWAYIPASIGVLWLGERVYEQALVAEADKATALEAGQPPVVELGQFDWTRDVHIGDEVHIRGLINHEYDYELVESTNGVPTKTRHLYMIFAENDPEGANVVRGALMLNKREEAAFLDTKAEEWTVGETETGWIYQFNGFAERSVTLDDMAEGAIAEQGLTMADDFVYIEPFFEGRKAALTPQGVPDQTRMAGWAIAAFVALIGVAKRVMSVRARPSRDELEEAAAVGEADETDPIPAPAMSYAVPSGVSADTPLGRLARRNGAAAEPVFDEQPMYTAYKAAELEPVFEDEEEEPIGARPQGAPVFDEGARVEDELDSRFPPIPGDDQMAPEPGDARFPPVPDDGEQAEANRSSAVGFYVKLGIAMLVVGWVAYQPSLLSAALPFAGVALFWLGVYVVFQKIRAARRRDGAAGQAPQHQRRPDGAAQTAAAGVGGHRIDLTGPVQSAAQERGVV